MTEPISLLDLINTAAGRSAAHVSDVQLEEITGISRHTWRRWRQESRGPLYLKLGRAGGQGRVLYRLSDVLAFLEAATVPPDETEGDDRLSPEQEGA
jgi:hypothetical protein